MHVSRSSPKFSNNPSPIVRYFSAVALTFLMTPGWLVAGQPVGWPKEISLERLAQSSDPKISYRASTLQKGLARRTWNYVGDDGVSRSFEDRFGSVTGEDEQSVVTFQSRARIPIQYLSEKDQTWVANILRFQALCKIDADREYQRQLEAKQQSLLPVEPETPKTETPSAKVLLAQLRRDTSVTVTVGHEQRTMKVNRGETFQVMETRPQHLLISYGGQPAVLLRRDARVYQASGNAISQKNSVVNSIPSSATMPSSLTLPVIGNPTAVWPRRLDVDVDYIQRRDTLRVKVNDVIHGGVGERMGLKRGDTIVRVNGQDLASKQQFRAAILSSHPPVLHVVGLSGKSRLLSFSASSQSHLLQGVHGHLNFRNEFEIDFVASHDAVTRQLQLSRGDVILAVDGKRVHSREAILQTLQSLNTSVTFLVLRRGHLQPTSVPVILPQLGQLAVGGQVFLH